MISPQRRGRLTFFAALLLIPAAPFETLQPWVSLPYQELSNLEIVIFLALLLGLIDAACGLLARGRAGSAAFVRLLRHGLSRRPFFAPLALLVVIMTVAAVTAPEFSGSALRFMGRFSAGFLIYLLFSRAASSQGRLVLLLTVSAIPAVVVSLSGILEYLGWGPVFKLLEPFRVGPNYAGTSIRASGTLQYPTITAMYLEIAFGWILGLLVGHVQGRRRWAAAGFFLAELVVGVCLLQTLTRSALVLVFVMLGVSMVSVGRHQGYRAVAAPALLSLSLCSILGLMVLAESEVRLRLSTPDPRDWYRARYEAPASLEMRPGEISPVSVTLTNQGLAAWTPDSTPPFRLSYHWLSEDGNMVIEFEGLRTELPRTVRPNESLTLRATVRAPPRPGVYLLAWDLLQEDRFWFSLEFSPSSYTRVRVSGAAIRELEPHRSLPMSRLRLERYQLWQAALKLLARYPLLGVGPDNFRFLYGTVLDLEVADLTYHTHNLYLEFFVGSGLLGGVVFLWLAWRLASHAAGLLIRRPRDWRVTMGPALAVGAILMHGFVDYFLQFTPTYLMTFAAFGILEAAIRIRDE